MQVHLSWSNNAGRAKVQLLLNMLTARHLEEKLLTTCTGRGQEKLTYYKENLILIRKIAADHGKHVMIWKTNYLSFKQSSIN